MIRGRLPRPRFASVDVPHSPRPAATAVASSIASFAASFVAFVVVAAASAGAVHGAEKSRTAPAVKSTDRILTPAQLRECLVQKDQLRAQTDAALKDKADLATEKAEIDRSGSAIGEELASLDRTSAEAVEGHNAKVGVRDRLIEAYQAKVTAYNTRAEALQAAREPYEKACENRRYDDRDLIDLQRKKR